MANQKISTYLTEVLALVNNDRLDVSKEISPGVFDSQYLKYSTLLTELNADLTVSNLYNADGSLGGNRFVTLGGNDLTFVGTVDANLLRLDPTTDFIGIGTITPSEKLEVIGNVKIFNGLDVDSSTLLIDSASSSFSLGAGATPELDSRAVTIGGQAATFTGAGSVSIAIGYQCTAIASGATKSNIAIGYQAKAPSGDNVISIGDQSGSGIGAHGSQSILIGYLARNVGATSGIQTIAIGDQTDASGVQATLLGSQAEVSANFAIAIGRQAKANDASGIAIGFRAETGAARAYVIGSGNTNAPVNSQADSLGIGFNEAAPNNIRFLFSKTADSYLNGSGNVGIGTTTPSDQLEVVGNLNATRYKVGGVPGANHSGAVATITVVDGLVTLVT